MRSASIPTGSVPITVGALLFILNTASTVFDALLVLKVP